MTAARTARRGLIGWILLHRIEVTDRHPVLMFVGLFATLVVGCCLQGLLP
jgi:hypothetical protein